MCQPGHAVQMKLPNFNIGRCLYPFKALLMLRSVSIKVNKWELWLHLSLLSISHVACMALISISIVCRGGLYFLPNMREQVFHFSWVELGLELELKTIELFLMVLNPKDFLLLNPLEVALDKWLDGLLNSEVEFCCHFHVPRNHIWDGQPLFSKWSWSVHNSGI